MKPKTETKKRQPLIVNGWLTVTKLSRVERISITIHADPKLVDQSPKDIWKAMKGWLKPNIIGNLKAK